MEILTKQYTDYVSLVAGAFYAEIHDEGGEKLVRTHVFMEPWDLPGLFFYYFF